MSFELIKKTEYEDGYTYYIWEYRPVKDGWGETIFATKAVEDIADSVSIDIEGPYAGEMDFADIGFKTAKSYKDMNKEELERDENSEVKIYAKLDGETYHIYIEPKGDSIVASVSGGDTKTVKLFSTAIKKALDKSVSF